MSDKRLLLLNYALFALYGVLTVGFQTSLWVQLLGGFPAPHFWIPILAYWALYRIPREGVLMTYITTFIIGSVTALPLGMFLLINLTLYLAAAGIKAKFYQPGPIFFAFICAAMSLLFMPIHWIYSLVLETNPIVDLEVLNWIAQSTLTPLLAFIVYPIFCIIDDLTQKDLPTEVGRQFG
ncbi:MAG: hypothetical protein R2827_09055 [Bdellovibrionales bacterium]